MLEAGLAVGVVSFAIAIPHAVPLHRARPATAAAVWLLALALRALVTLGAALLACVYLPGTDAFRHLAAWYWHEALPVIALHLGVSGHPIAHAVVALPSLMLAVSVVSLILVLMRAWLALRRWLAGALCAGPLGATVIPNEEIVLAATRLGRARILVSRGALRRLDPAELQAGLAHERGHLTRGHRPVLLLASFLWAVGRLLPGGRAARGELFFNLERDADGYAVRETRDPLSLASAICKTAASPTSSALAALSGGGHVVQRVNQLIEPGSGADREWERSARSLACVLGGFTATLALTFPSWALATADGGSGAVSLLGACSL